MLLAGGSARSRRLQAGQRCRPDPVALAHQGLEESEEVAKNKGPRARLGGIQETMHRDHQHPKGIIQHVRPIQEVDLDNILLVERFSVEQLDSEGNLKIRPIDNYRSNDDQTVSCESVSNDREDIITEAILRLKHSLQSAGEAVEVLVGLEHCVGAYRTLPPSQHQRWLMQLLVWDTDSEEWKVCEPTDMPSGVIGGVLAWWRIARGLRTICRNILRLIIFYCVDDTHLVERGRTATSGKEDSRNG